MAITGDEKTVKEIIQEIFQVERTQEISVEEIEPIPNTSL